MSRNDLIGTKFERDGHDVEVIDVTAANVNGTYDHRACLCRFVGRDNGRVYTGYLPHDEVLNLLEAPPLSPPDPAPQDPDPAVAGGGAGNPAPDPDPEQVQQLAAEAGISEDAARALLSGQAKLAEDGKTIVTESGEVIGTVDPPEGNEHTDPPSGDPAEAGTGEDGQVETPAAPEPAPQKTRRK